ncbi:MAG: hypothetical protein M3Z75_28520 [Actinomycetota bacterium]|nr:hypothetical protein [Actinomycetota bacterium]
MPQVVDGITTGSIYAALALVYPSTGLVNFAQGQMAVVSVYIAWSLTSAVCRWAWPSPAHWWRRSSSVP